MLQEPLAGTIELQSKKEDSRSSFTISKSTEQKYENDIEYEDLENEDDEDNAINYALQMMELESINDHKSQLRKYLPTIPLPNQITERDFKNKVIQHLKCQNNESLIKQISKLYHCMKQYDKYQELRDTLHSSQQNKNKCKCSCRCNCCYSSKSNHHISIKNRRTTSNSITLYSKHDENDDDNKQLELEINRYDTIMQHSPSYYPVLEVSRSKYIIHSKLDSLERDDVLTKMEFDGKEYHLSDLKLEQVYNLIEYTPLPFTLYFDKRRIKCDSCLRKFKCCGRRKKNKSKKDPNKKSSEGKCNKCISCLKHPIQKSLTWFAKFMKLSLKILSKTSAVIDSVTDILLLYTASQNKAISFTILIFLTLLSPYILSYSSGVQIFLYRKTFQNVQLFTFKSFLLGLYLFPTGIMYFILLDIIDVFKEFYIWIAYGCINKIKNETELIQIESTVAEYFGMSRMDWISFKKQKLISQLLLSFFLIQYNYFCSCFSEMFSFSVDLTIFKTSSSVLSLFCILGFYV